MRDDRAEGNEWLENQIFILGYPCMKNVSLFDPIITISKQTTNREQQSLKEGMEFSSLFTDADPSIHYSSSSARSLVVPQSCQFGHKIVLVDFLFRFVGPTVVVADVAHGSCDGRVVGSGRRFGG